MVKSFIEMEIIFDNNNDMINTLCKCKDINKDFVKYFFDGLRLLNVLNKNDEDEPNDNKIEIEDNTVEIENNKNMIKTLKFLWRNGQLEALKKIIDNDFESGLVSMITGSGKSLIFLKTIYNHLLIKKPKKGSVYILLCPRIDILKSLFFEYDKESKKMILDESKIKYWKDNDIINLKKINVIDCVNGDAKNVKFDKEKYNLLLINNDAFRALYKIKKLKDYVNENTNLTVIDECQCLSGDKIYEIVEEMKYDHKISIMGFSATAIRNSKKSETNVKHILSKTFDRNKKDKKINLIYSYDLLQGILENIVLPYKITCVKMNKIKGHKIGFTNKSILKDILKKCIDVKTNKLPYKKFVVWTNTREIMMECYLFVKKEFPELKVYCTSSFDRDMSKNGMNTDYEEFYESNGNCILICINKCKEGSDIPYVDCGIYFDGVKNRSILVHIQTSGRLIRPDKEGKKTHGELIDTFILDNSEKSHTLTAQKILSYLTRLLNLSDDEYEDQIEYYKQMSTLAENMEYNSKEQTLKIKINDNKYGALFEFEKMEMLEMDWMAIKKELYKQVDKKFCISEEQKFKIIIQKLKNVKEFKKDCDFWKVYDKYRDKYKLPEDLKETYKHKFEEKTWYELLGIDTKEWYQSYTQIKKKVSEFGQFDKKTYQIAIKKCEKLPPYPEYLIPNFWNKTKTHDY
jgi:superfamily II DNA or RNA helicase